MRELLEGIDAGMLLPSEWYADAEIFERERRARPASVMALRRTHRSAVPRRRPRVVRGRGRAGRVGPRRGRRDPRVPEHLPAPRTHRRARRASKPATCSAATTAGRTDLDGSLARRAAFGARARMGAVRHRPAAGAGRGLGTDRLGQRRRGHTVLRGVDRRSRSVQVTTHGARSRHVRVRVRQDMDDRHQLEGLPGERDRVLSLRDRAIRSCRA